MRCEPCAARISGSGPKLSFVRSYRDRDPLALAELQTTDVAIGPGALQFDFKFPGGFPTWGGEITESTFGVEEGVAPSSIVGS